MNFYSNGKLLLTAEYFVLEGATALAIPTQKGQSLTISKIAETGSVLHWQGFDNQGVSWLEGSFDLNNFSILKGNPKALNYLQKVLCQARTQNPDFLKNEATVSVQTHLDFPTNWGLGSSSTFVNNVAQWAEIDPFELQFAVFGGSGYDIACAMCDHPIFYTKTSPKPTFEIIEFNPVFKDQLYFVHLGKKQNSRKGIAHFYEYAQQQKDDVERVSEISHLLAVCGNLANFETLLNEHEHILSKALGLPKVKALYFDDYWGTVKSLGAWGGDFALVTSNKSTTITESYFKKRGFTTFVPYAEMVLETAKV